MPDKRLSERVRECLDEWYFHEESEEDTRQTLAEWADEIAAPEAENATLRAEVERLKLNLCNTDDFIRNVANNMLKRAEAEGRG